MYGVRMECLWNSYGTTRYQHRAITGSIPCRSAVPKTLESTGALWGYRRKQLGITFEVRALSIALPCLLRPIPAPNRCGLRYQQGSAKLGSLRITIGSLSFTGYGTLTGPALAGWSGTSSGSTVTHIPGPSESSSGTTIDPVGSPTGVATVVSGAFAGAVVWRLAVRAAWTDSGQGGGAEAVRGRSPGINSRSCSIIALMS